MRTVSSLPDGRKVRTVSETTEARYNNPSMMLTARVAGDRQPTGACFIFTLNPESFGYSQGARTSVQDTRGGWIVNESGMGAPHFRLSGTFGWRLRSIPVAQFQTLAPGAVGYFPRLGQNVADENIYNQIGPTTQTGKGVSFVLDGVQAWTALRDFILWYSENNEQRVRAGQRPLEMVFYDTLHSLRWVVAPTAAPTLDHTVSKQGVTPYTLELIGVYDDARPKAAQKSGLPQLWGAQEIEQ